MACNLSLILRRKNNHRLRVPGRIFGPKHQSEKDFLPGGAHYLTYSDQTVEWPTAQ